MSSKTSKTLSLAIGAAFVGSFAMAPDADAAGFGMKDLDAGYQLVGEHGDDKDKEGKCGEGKCGEDKGGEGSCGEGHDKDKGGEGSCGEDKGEEGKCGEGKCGGAA